MPKSLAELRDDLSHDVVTLLNAEPFWGHVLVPIQKVVDPRLRAAASIWVASHVLLKVHPIGYFRHEKRHRTAILKHELLHIVLKHPIRLAKLAVHKKANVAADLSINPLIGKENLPPTAIFPSMYGFPDGLTAEEYYDIIPEPVKREPGGSGQPSETGPPGGPSSDLPVDPDDFDIDHNPYLPEGIVQLDDHDWEGVLENEGLAEIVIDDIIREAERRCGDIPGGIKDMIRYREKHVVPWESVVRRFIGTSRANLTWTKKRFSRRFRTRPGIKLKGGATILIAIDSSGSISNEELSAFMTELWAAHQTRLVDLWGIICDAEITEIIHPIRKITLIEGRGGTDFRPVFKWALDEAHHPPFDGIIYLTDGYGPAPTHRPRIPTLWVITHDGTDPTASGSIYNDDDDNGGSNEGWGQKLKLPEMFEKDKIPVW